MGKKRAHQPGYKQEIGADGRRYWARVDSGKWNVEIQGFSEIPVDDQFEDADGFVYPAVADLEGDMLEGKVHGINWMDHSRAYFEGDTIEEGGKDWETAHEEVMNDDPFLKFIEEYGYESKVREYMEMDNSETITEGDCETSVEDISEIRGEFEEWRDERVDELFEAPSENKPYEYIASSMVTLEDGTNEIVTAHMGGYAEASDGSEHLIEGPVMNYWSDMEHGDAEELAKAIADLPLEVVTDDYGDVVGLSLSGGGMDLTPQICEAYVRGGQLPPLHYATSYPRMADSWTPERRRVLDACRESVRQGYANDPSRMQRYLKDLDSVEDMLKEYTH